MAKNNSKPTGIIIGLILLLIIGVIGATTYYYGFIKEEAIPPSNTPLAKPLFKTVKCLQDTNILESEETWWDYKNLLGHPLTITKDSVATTNGVTLYCGRETFTDECDFYAKMPTQNKYGQGTAYVTPYKEVRFYVCPINATVNNVDDANKLCEGRQIQYLSNVDIYESQPFKTLQASQNKKIFAYCEAGLFGSDVPCVFKYSYKTWNLEEYSPTSGTTKIGSATCSLYDTKYKDINTGLTSSVNPLHFIKSTEPVPPSDGVIAFGGFVNMIADYFYSPNTNVFKYQGKDVYCDGKNYYAISEFQVKDGLVIKVNPDYKTDESVTGIKSVGEIVLSGIQCCPTMGTQCTIDGKYKSPTGSECLSDSQCFNEKSIIPGTKTYHQQKCLPSKTDVTVSSCQWQEPVSVECTDNSQCLTGQVCDLSNINFGKCIGQSPRYCGDNICLSPESSASCPVDCGTEKVDDGSGINWLVIALFGVVIVLLLALLLVPGQKKNIIVRRFVRRK